MAGSSNFVEFNPTLANAEDDATYAADASVTGGLTNGIASTTMHNKLFHQVSIVASMIGNFISGQGGAASDVDASALLTAFKNSLSSFIALPVTTALSDVIMGDGSGNWVKQTIAQLKSALALGTAAYQNTTAFDAAGAASTVQTNLNSHTGNHSNPHAVTAAQAGAIPNSAGAVSNWNLGGAITYDKLAGNIQNSQLAGGITGDKLSLKVQGGSTNITLPFAGTGTVSVTFSPAFPGTPYVMMTITVISGTNLTQCQCQAWAASASGFSAQVANAGNAGSCTINWIAIWPA